MRRNSLVWALTTVSLLVAAGRAAADTYQIEVQSDGPGIVSPSGVVEVPAGGSQTFTFTPSGCSSVGEVTVDEVPVGSGITEYTLTNVQGDHVLYVPFNPCSTTTTLDVRPAIGQCAVPETLTATVTNADGGAVQFFKDEALIGTSAVSGGVATYIIAAGLAAGSYSFHASYLGTPNSTPSFTDPQAYEVEETGPVPITLTLNLYGGSGPNTQVGVLSAFEVKLFLGGAYAVEQNVQYTYYDGDVVIGGAFVRGGYTTFLYRPMIAGTLTITAVAQFVGCSGTVTSNPVELHVAPNPGDTNMSLSITPNPVPPGGSVVLSALLDPQWVTGLVRFVDVTNSVELGSSSLHQGGDVSFTYGPVVGSDRVIEARYVGDANYHPCTSNQVLLHIDAPVATLMARFDAARSDDGIELRWRTADPSRVISVAVERAREVTGPWMGIAPERRDEDGVTVALDRTANDGDEWFYRLGVQLADGGRTVFGPVSAQGVAAGSRSDLTRLWPNPTSRGAQVQYSVARAGRVRVEVLNVSGGIEEALVDRVLAPGRYVVSWDGTGSRGGKEPGIYFVHMVAPGQETTRRLAIIR